jgi:hypothetical protein
MREFLSVESGSVASEKVGTMKRISIFRRLGGVIAVVLFAGCGQPMTPSPEAEPRRTLPPTVAVEVSPGTIVSRPAMLDSLEEAQELVSFRVLVPDPETLPAGSGLEKVEWQPDPERGMEMVALSYRDTSNGMDLHIQQIDPGGHPTAPPDQPHEKIDIRGTTGYLLSFEHAEGQGPVALTWEEHEVSITVSASGLTVEQALRIVEGMKPVGR